MPCPHNIERAIQRCPFLREVCVRDGAEFARHIATRPSRRFVGPVLEEHGDYAATFHLFHGPAGVVPLAAERKSSVAHDPVFTSPPPISSSAANSSSEQQQQQQQQPRRRATAHPLWAATASISLSGFGFLPGARELFGLGKGKGRKPKRNPEGSKSNGNPGSQPGPAQPSASQPSPGSSSAHFMRITNPLGGLLAMSAKGQLKCPEAIVRMRATVARMKPVRELRPQALPVKLLAVAAFTGLANLPSGAFRVHVKKFSPGWILAVHATIPFIAVIRKAVVMPKWAIAFTVGSAVLGQLMGARLERQRMLDYQLLVEERKNGSKNSSSGGGTAPAHAADGIMGWPRAVGLQCREQAFALGIGCSPIVA